MRSAASSVPPSADGYDYLAATTGIAPQALGSGLAMRKIHRNSHNNALDIIELDF